MSLWPLSGCWLFLRSPRWWLRPLLATALGWLTLVGIFAGVVLWRWPAADAVGWTRIWEISLAMGQASAGVLVGWLVVMPILMSLAMEDLARQVLRRAGIETEELSVWRSLWATARVVINTLPMRLGWAGAGVVLGVFAGPVGAIVGALGMGQVACLDAYDLALSLRGLDGRARLRLLAERRSDRRSAGIMAGILNLLLAASVVLWPLWLPGLVVGAAREVARWSIPTTRR
jgi:hypothetical protein